MGSTSVHMKKESHLMRLIKICCFDFGRSSAEKRKYTENRFSYFFIHFSIKHQTETHASYEMYIFYSFREVKKRKPLNERKLYGKQKVSKNKIIWNIQRQRTIELNAESKKKERKRVIGLIIIWNWFILDEHKNVEY